MLLVVPITSVALYNVYELANGFILGTVVPAALLCTASQLDPAHKYVIVAIITVGHSFCEGMTCNPLRIG